MFAWITTRIENSRRNKLRRDFGRAVNEMQSAMNNDSSLFDVLCATGALKSAGDAMIVSELFVPEEIAVVQKRIDDAETVTSGAVIGQARGMFAAAFVNAVAATAGKEDRISVREFDNGAFHIVVHPSQTLQLETP